MVDATTIDLALSADRGCPSGLAPARDAGQRADPGAFVRRDSAGRSTLELLVKGARCAGCIRKIETGLRSLPGVEDARLNLSTGRLAVTWRSGALAPHAITDTLDRLGYETAPFDAQEGAKAVDDEGRFLLRCMAVSAFASMNVMMFTAPTWGGHELGDATRQTFYFISALIAIPSGLYAGRPFFRSAWRALKNGRANMDVPISLAVVLTLAVSLVETFAGGEHAYFDGVVMLLFFLLIGRWLDHELREKARSAAKDLLAMQAVTAARLRADGVLENVRARDIVVGDLIQLAAGDRAPVDGVIENGVSEIDRSLITGESAPAPARAGDRIHAGVVNLTCPLTLRATATSEASTVAELARLIENGAQNRSRQIRLADRAAELYVPIVHTLALATFLGWWLIGDASIREALLIACAVLIITCPCALALAAPAVQIVATGSLFKAGILVKSGDALERLAAITKVVLDKTGTLTIGRPRLVSGGDLDHGVLMQAAELARASRHPLSRALVDAAGPGEVAKDVVETPGAGVAGVVDGVCARLGRADFVSRDGRAKPGEGSELWFVRGDSAPVRFAFVDALRSDAASVVAELDARGLAPELLSGDRGPAVAGAARATGIAYWTGEATPTDKTARLDALRDEGHRVLMIGDGLNDAAALARAHASASPGSAIDATQAASDIVFQGDRLGAVVTAIDAAKAAKARMVENFAFAALYNVVAVPVAAAGFVTPFIAACAMAGSSLVVTLNALRLSRIARAGAPLRGLRQQGFVQWTPRSS